MLRTYFGQAKKCVESKDGRGIAKLLQTDHAEVLTIINRVQPGMAPPSRQWREAADECYLSEEWGDIFTSHLLFMLHLARGEMVAAYTQLVNSDDANNLSASKKLENIVRNATESWVIEPFVRMATNMRIAAERADAELRRAQKKPDKLESCGTALQSFLNALISAKGKVPKKYAVLGVTSQLFTVYTRLNNLTAIKQTLKNLNQNMANGSVPNTEEFPLQYQVPFRYRWGQMLLFDENFAAAEEQLMQAFQDCPSAAAKNQKQILRLLLPVRMIRGSLPTDELLSKYGFPELRAIAEAVRLGDVGMLSRTLDAHYTKFIAAGTYLILEKLKLVACRQLFRNVALVHAEVVGQQDKKAMHVPMSVFEAMLNEQGEDIDAAGTECMLANLIFRGFVKGYISHSQRVVVLAKSGAFPALVSVDLRDPSHLLL